MVYVDIEKCTGCGICAQACPVEAISLVGGTAQVDQEGCTDCEACVEVCPNRAMFAVREPVERRVVVPSIPPATEALQLKPQPAPVSLWARAAPAVGAALTFLGRNVVPRVADHLLHALDDRLGQEQASPVVGASGSSSPASGVGGRRPSSGPSSGSGRGSGRRLRRRKRRGQG